MSGLPLDTRSPHQQQRWIELKNTGGSDIPAFAVVEVDGASHDDMGRTILHVKRPTADNLANVVVNGAQVIPVGEQGRVGTNDFPAYVLCTGGTPAAGERWGTTANSYYIQQNKSGFRICGDHDTATEVVRVMRDSAGSRWLFGQLAEHMCTTDANADCDNLTDVDTGESVSNLTAKNTFTLAGRDNDYVLLKWIETINDWVIVQVQHHLVSVLVDLTLSSTHIVGVRRDIAAMYCGDEYNDNLIELEDC